MTFGFLAASAACSGAAAKRTVATASSRRVDMVRVSGRGGGWRAGGGGMSSTSAGRWEGGAWRELAPDRGLTSFSGGTKWDILGHARPMADPAVRTTSFPGATNRDISRHLQPQAVLPGRMPN